MIRLREFAIKYFDTEGETRFTEISAKNTSEALEKFFSTHCKDDAFAAIYEKR